MTTCLILSTSHLMLDTCLSESNGDGLNNRGKVYVMTENEYIGSLWLYEKLRPLPRCAYACAVQGKKIKQNAEYKCKFWYDN